VASIKKRAARAAKLASFSFVLSFTALRFLLWLAISALVFATLLSCQRTCAARYGDAAFVCLQPRPRCSHRRADVVDRTIKK
jgi:hypothetical protein